MHVKERKERSELSCPRFVIVISVPKTDLEEHANNVHIAN